MSVDIRAQFKKDSRVYNGLEAILAQLLDYPNDRFTCVVRGEVTDINESIIKGGVRTPKVNFYHIEVMQSDVEEKTATKLLEDAYHARVGKTKPLPQGTLFDKDDDDESGGGAGDGDAGEPADDQE